MTKMQGLLGAMAVFAMALYGVSSFQSGEPFRLAKLPLVTAQAEGGDSHALQNAQAPVEIVNADLIRVGISDDGMTNYEYPGTRISATGGFRVTSPNGGNGAMQVVYTGAAGDSVFITLEKTGFMLKTTSAKPGGSVKTLGPFMGPLKAEPTEAGSFLRLPDITRTGKVPSYRGTLEITRGYSSPIKLSVVNILPLQDYLKAVVPNELPIRFGYEAVKAQAVAARNYAIRPREKFWPQFDICDSQYCQAYYGYQTETPETTKALADTQGLMALYQGEPILALYSSSHGGYSENYSFAFSEPKTNQFPAKPIPYLQGSPDMKLSVGDLRTEQAARAFWLDRNTPSYDVKSPHYRWERMWDAVTLRNTLDQTLAEVSKDPVTAPFVFPLFKQGDSVGMVKKINVKERGVSGKAMVVEIEGTRGLWTLKKEFVIRKVFKNAGKMLPSANVVFTPVHDAKGYVVKLTANGGGFGHGVGMSQLGASWMSGQGFDFPQILQHYYKGISIGSLPLKVGPGHYSQPVKTTFFARHAEGILRVESDTSDEPVRVMLNDKTLSLEQFKKGGMSYPLRNVLKPGETNTLVLYPDATHPNRKIKAWVELYPAKPGETVASNKDAKSKASR